MHRTRVILAEDRAENLETGAHALRALSAVDLVGVGRSGAEALDRVLLLRPDVVFLDLLLRRPGGLETAHRIRESGVATNVVLLALGDGFDHRFAAREVGARGVVKRSDFVMELPCLIERFATPVSIGIRQPWLAAQPLPERAVRWLRDLTPAPPRRARQR
jgi:DNA-binding NarL/FixJ family response regulator